MQNDPACLLCSPTSRLDEAGVPAVQGRASALRSSCGAVSAPSVQKAHQFSSATGSYDAHLQPVSKGVVWQPVLSVSGGSVFQTMLVLYFHDVAHVFSKFSACVWCLSYSSNGVSILGVAYQHMLKWKHMPEWK